MSNIPEARLKRLRDSIINRVMDANAGVLAAESEAHMWASRREELARIAYDRGFTVAEIAARVARPECEVQSWVDGTEASAQSRPR